MKRLLIDRFYGGVSTDPYLGLNGSLYCGEGVEIRQNSKNVFLSKGSQSFNKLSSSSNDLVAGYLVESNTKYLRCHLSGYLTDRVSNNIDTNNVVINLGKPLYNIGAITTDVTTNNSNKYGFIISKNQIFKFVYNKNLEDLGVKDINGSINLVPSFSIAGAWTAGTGWTNNGTLTHTGAGGNISATSTTTSGQFVFGNVSLGQITAGICTLRIGGVAVATFGVSDSFQTITFLRIPTANNEPVVFEAGTGFEGTINSLILNPYLLTSYSTPYEIPPFCPYIIIDNFIYIGAGNRVLQIDTTTDNWIIEQAVRIDTDFAIRGITKIADQVFIYATDGQNSRQYIWDGVNESTSGYILWKDKNIQNVVTFANEDYVITRSLGSNSSGLIKVTGYTPIYVALNGENNNISNERIFFNSEYVNAIETIGTKMIIPSYKGMYTYGGFTPGLPSTLIKEYRFMSSGDFTDLDVTGKITAMSYNEGTLGYFFYSLYNDLNGEGVLDNGVYESILQINYGYNTNPLLSGFIATPKILGQAISNKKTLEKITAGVKLQEGTLINFYINNCDDTTNYVNITYKYTNIPAVGDTYTSGSNTFTIYKITDLDPFCILHCTLVGDNTFEGGTFTRTSGTGDTSFFSKSLRYGYKLVSTATDITQRRHQIKATETATDFNELVIGVELLTKNINNTPALNNIFIYLNQSEDD